MGSTRGSEYQYQRYIAMTIKAEASARGWELTELAERSGINYQTLLRKLNLKRHFAMGEVSQIADALGMRMSELTADAERRRDRDLHPDDATLTMEQPPAGADVRILPGTDVRTLITWLLNHPEQDVSLINRLDDSVGQTGLKGRRLAELQETIRDVRREELMNALDVLPPPTSQGGDQSG